MSIGQVQQERPIQTPAPSASDSQRRVGNQILQLTEASQPPATDNTATSVTAVATPMVSTTEIKPMPIAQLSHPALSSVTPMANTLIARPQPRSQIPELPFRQPTPAANVLMTSTQSHTFPRASSSALAPSASTSQPQLQPTSIPASIAKGAPVHIAPEGFSVLLPQGRYTSNATRYTICAAIPTPRDWADLSVRGYYEKHVPVLYDNISDAPAGEEISFLRSPHDWPVTVLTRRVSEDFGKPVRFAVDFFGWYLGASQQFFRMEPSKKRDSLGAYLISACEWARKHKESLDEEWMLGENLKVHTLDIIKCLRLVLLIRQKVQLFRGSECEFSGKIFRIVFERIDINAASSRILGPDHIMLHGMSDRFGAWSRNIEIEDLDTELELRLDGEEVSSKDLFS